MSNGNKYDKYYHEFCEGFHQLYLKFLELEKLIDKIEKEDEKLYNEKIIKLGKVA
ncbi:hypothetical protein H3T59_01645 [Commensalibacter sp. M0357]|uniref:hypothetical protein n=1 Tax=Commensalibacter TaxID=1079922 RepID=UPI0012D94355|nr:MULTISPECIES: hypothetical protein [Commensalibacter]MBI0074329.1 hypothetical protein [Commensalibacter sp. M0357]MBI0084170.1 hypothetical protein [Commensalibacter sp. M0355]MUH07177.1 hypothetical protein [Commensalibacter melissae]